MIPAVYGGIMTPIPEWRYKVKKSKERPYGAFLIEKKGSVREMGETIIEELQKQLGKGQGIVAEFQKKVSAARAQLNQMGNSAKAAANDLRTFSIISAGVQAAQSFAAFRKSLEAVKGMA